MRLTRFAFLLGICCLLYGTACDVINPEEPIPAFIYVTPFELNTELGQGTDNTQITEVWVIAGGNFIGTFSLPAKVPILAEGDTEIILQAGIKDNGISSTPEIYPFYEPYTVSLDLTPLKTDTINAVIQYREEAEFSMILDFENSDVLFTELRVGDNSTRMERTQEEVFEGNFSGKITISEDNGLSELATSVRYNDLQAANGQAVYLEVNYKSDIPVIWGVYGHETGVSGVGVGIFDPGFAPKDEWNKIYFNLTYLLDQFVVEEFQLGLQAFIPEENGTFVQSTGTVYLDNIKLVHF